MIDVKVGDRVYMLKGNGDKVEYAMVLWVGQLPAEHVGNNRGLMAGIQFDNPVGKGNGSLGLTQYFQAKVGHAAFVPATMLHKVNADSLSLFSSSYTTAPPLPAYETRRQLTNNSNVNIRPGTTITTNAALDPSTSSSSSSSSVHGYRNFDVARNINKSNELAGADSDFVGGVTSTPIGTKPAIPPIGTRPTTGAATTAAAAAAPAAALASPSSNLEYNIFSDVLDPRDRRRSNGGFTNVEDVSTCRAYVTDPAAAAFASTVAAGAFTTTTTRTTATRATDPTTPPGYFGDAAYFGEGVGRASMMASLAKEDDEEEEVFESDDDLEEALQTNESEICKLAKMMRSLPTPSSSPDAEAKSKAASPDLNKSTNKDINVAKINNNNNNNNNGGFMKTKNAGVAGTPASPSSTRLASSSPPPPPPEAPTASTEWSVVVSKIKKAPKQVRDQLKPPEKKLVAAVKPKTKVEKLLEDNPKYKSTLCSWYIQGARCPNGNECHFAHGESELRAIPRPKYKYKTQVCSYYAAGHCGNGSACHFAHGLADLQKKI